MFHTAYMCDYRKRHGLRKLAKRNEKNLRLRARARNEAVNASTTRAQSQLDIL